MPDHGASERHLKNLEDDEIMFFCKNVMTEFPLTDEVEVDEIIIQFYANVLS